MLIDGREYKINVLILLMEKERQVTVETVETLLEGLEDGVVVSVLLNGGTLPELNSLFSGRDCIRYYESPVNLGVAGGRNFLLGTEECKCCDIVMVLDNDVATPTDYVRSLATFLVRHKEAGVVGGAAADINHAGMDAIRWYGGLGAWGGRVFRMQCDGIRQSVGNGFAPSKLYHLGTHPDYNYTYFSAMPLIRMLTGRIGAVFGRPRSHQPILKFNEKWLGMVTAGADKIEVSNVAGCSQAFRRSFVDEVGGLNDMFNPYGYEDVDFCIRALKAGYRNYVDLGTWLYHGTDSRHRERPAGQMARLLFRGRTVLVSLNFSGGLRLRLIMFKLMAAEIIKAFILRGGEAAGIAAGVWHGYKDGMELLRRNGGDAKNS